MPYVDSDGRVLQQRPWSLARIMDMFWGVVNIFTQFFQTLIPGDALSGGSSSGSNRRPGDGPPRPPRRMGTMKTIQDCSMPGGG